ncbi:hypothetical protein PRIPAC_73138 [Pristionchus pacificus]|uniref:Uncharacterized protein n=1 Tax=Pristionchus pacificus TaxID=54126 RepID=A0A2A6BF42_PRIPA|nr:hypothetical protein PRIPAC_73138 [Pristionchus pacificus]|eukprot:PDM64473.1 hypothetical protein PRIPAC_52729 [Pristionchus pacificus]
MLANLLIASLLVSLATAAVDTQGTEYRVVFPRNFELSSTNCDLSISIVNPNTAEVKVSISYYKTLYDYSSQQNELLSVPAGGIATQGFPKFDAWEYMNGGFQEQFDTRIVVTTSLPVNLYANNYQKDGFGDTFLVLPYSMGGSSYAFTLPAPSALQNGVIQYAIAYIIPTRADVNVEITVGSWNEKRKIPFKVGSNVNYFAVPHVVNQKDPSFYITGDKDFMVVAAVSCLPLSDGKCDYAAFMPTPVVLPGQCRSPTPVADNHPTDLITSRKFSITPNLQSGDCNHNTVNFYNGDMSDEQNLSGEIYTAPNLFGDRFIVGSTSIPTGPIRIGGLPGTGGAFLTGLPSTTQFVTGTTYFLTRTEKATLYIITDAVASLTMRLDGKVVNFSPEILKIDGVQYHFTTAEVLSDNSPAVHKLDASPGKYVFYVTGTQRDGHAYGYYPAFNKLKSQ